jgi:hypothetical protein
VFNQMVGESVFWLLLVLTPTFSIMTDLTVRMVCSFVIVMGEIYVVWQVIPVCLLLQNR